jgi:hypothetical protein
MTGSLQGGQKVAIRQYNAIRNHLQDEGVIPEELFQELDEDEATFDELGVVAGMLDGYLEDDDEGDRSERGRDRRKRRFVMGMGDLGDLHELRHLGEVIRECMPEIVRAKARARAGKVDWDVRVDVRDDEDTQPAAARKPEDIAAEMEQTAEEFRREDLEFDERMHLANRIAELSRELKESA